MSGDAPQFTAARRWPTGAATLGGLALGALVGVLVAWVPPAVMIGLALGVGVDSLLNIRLNGAPGLMEASRVRDDD
jgi:hypothetical protein